MISWPLVKYVLTAALRDKLVLSLFILMTVGASMAIFLGSAAVVEANEFSVIFAAAGLRLAGVIGLVLFIVFYLRRAFDTKDVEFLLSRPVSKVSYLLSHSVGFMTLACLAAVFVFVTVCLIAPQAIGTGHVLWGLSLVAEYIILANAALFFAMVLPSAATGALAIFALYFLGRMIGQILGIIHAGADVAGFNILSTIMEWISLIVPRLDLLAQSSWLVYGSDQTVGYGFVLLQGGLYAFLAVMAAMVDLSRRQF
ncbi:MAG: hypothetical protein H6869_06020 [Rhodospirillales bacterium]|nr:hypothetical protein [Rhodospirillales bacterium]